MNFNTLLLRLGFKPDDFLDVPVDPLPFDGGFIFEAELKTTMHQCLNCKSTKTHIHGYSYVEYNCSENNNIEDILRIKKPRYLCLKCHKTYTPNVQGMRYRRSTSSLTEQLIYADFTSKLTFRDLARKYQISHSRVVQLFDEKVKFVPRLKMPRVLCIDEIRFSEEINQKFVCVLTDFEKGEIIDIIKNRQMAYLREYFGSIPLKEREYTKVFISDMYDAYASICRHYFPAAIHIADLFHVITQLTNAVNRIRTRVMNTESRKGSVEYNFMKGHWKYFLCRGSKIPDKHYTHMKTGEVFHYSDLVFRCIQLRMDLWIGYDALQEIFRYSQYATYEEALKFVERMSNKLTNSPYEDLNSVGRTYHKWRYEIANGFAKGNKTFHYTNAMAEGLNNQLKTIIKSAYGYHNFDRFRKRAMLIMTYGKKPK